MSFEEIYESYFSSVYKFVKMKTRNNMNSEDITVNIFENIYKNLESYSCEKGSLDVWIFAIARNEIISFYRKNKIQTVSMDNIAEASDISMAPEVVIDSKVNNKELVEAIDTLNENERQVITYKYGAGLKNTEIAKLMEISSSNVGVVLFRSIKKL